MHAGPKTRLLRSQALRLLAAAFGLAHDTRAGIALITAIAMPALLMSVAMGVEVSNWSTQQLSLQRTADMAALAGATTYARGASARQAAVAAAEMAELNGAAGATSRSWSAGSQTLTDNQITVQITSGVRNSADPAVQVTVGQTVPLLFSRIAVSSASISLGARAMAEIGTTQNGPQPCIVTLSGDANGVTSLPGFTLSGNTTASLSGCSLVSDSNIQLSGNLTVDASALYSAGTINMSGNVSGTGASPSVQHTGSPQISDPYASNSSVQNAIAAANCASPTTPVVTGNTLNLYPNVCYGSISASGNINIVFNGTGLYTINGSLSVSGNTSTTISGNGITIVSTQPLSISGNFSTGAVGLTAPTAGTATNGAVAGLLFATDSTGTSTISGNTAIPFTGLIYIPNGGLQISGNATDGSSGCSEVITSSFTVTGNVNLAANCSTYGLTTFGSLPNTTSIGLVE